MRRSLAVTLCLLAASACGSGGGGTTSGTSSGASSSTSGGSTTSGGPVTALGLWIDGTAAVAGTALGQSGTVAFSDTCPVPTSFGDQGSGAMVFDGSGNLWVQPFATGTPTILKWSAAQLAAACAAGTPAVTLTLSSASLLSGLAFDSQGNLWGSDTQDSELWGFKATDLLATGTISPTWKLSSYGGGTTDTLYTPRGLAIDSAGNLWVGKAFSLRGFKPAPQAAATADGGSTNPQGDFQITNAEAAAYEADAGGGSAGYGAYQYEWLAFDASGDLWVTVDNNQGAKEIAQIIEFSGAQLAALATNSQPAATFTLSETAALQAGFVTTFQQIAFDGAGNLWAGVRLYQPNLFRFPPSSFAAGGNGQADVILTVPSNDTSNLAFNPIPSGLPLRP